MSEPANEIARLRALLMAATADLKVAAELTGPLRDFYLDTAERYRRAANGTLMPEDQPDGVHTIPVPQGWSPEQAWEAIRRGEVLTDDEPSWVNIVVEDGKLVRLLDA